MRKFVSELRFRMASINYFYKQDRTKDNYYLLVIIYYLTSCISTNFL